MTQISFSIANYMTSTAPSWVTIDPSKGTLSFTTPEVSSDTEYSFYINSNITGASNLLQKLVKITVLNWIIDNCQRWSISNISMWEICYSGYDLISGKWEIQKVASETAKALSTTTTSIAWANVVIIAATSLVSTTSVASLWMTINQLQLFF